VRLRIVNRGVVIECDTTKTVTVAQYASMEATYTASMAKGTIHRIVATTALLCASLATGQAAEKIRWPDLQRRFGGKPECPAEAPCEGLLPNHETTVTTRDGHRRHTRNLWIGPESLRLDTGSGTELLDRNRVARIEVTVREEHYLHHIRESAVMPLTGAGVACSGLMGESGCNPLVFGVTLVILSPIWAYTAVSTPVLLVAEGVRFFVPSKKFEIVP
jgi:hypothetical protein